MKQKTKVIIGITVLLLIISGVLIFTSLDKPIPQQTTEAQQDAEFSLLSFNIQVFGTNKLAKVEVRQAIVTILSDFDISAIQEVRDSTGTAVPQLMGYMPDFYSYTLGPREGRTTSKEQYLIIYNKNKFDLIGVYVYPDPSDIFERNPYAAYFKTKDGKFDFVVIDNHISPGDALKEIGAMPDVFASVSSFFNEKDIVAVGDFNADGTYFKEDNIQSVFPVASYTNIITNDFDTTVADNSSTYDRIIITSSLNEDYTKNAGVLKFEDIFDFSTLIIKPKDISDHYPVWAKFYETHDTD